MGSSRPGWVLASLMLASSIATAQPQKEALRTQASDLVKKAIARSHAGDHAQAIDLYLQAYAIIPQPLLLSNVGSEYRQENKPIEALEYFCKYLVADPTGSNASYATAQAKALQIELGNQVDDKDVCKARPKEAPDTTGGTHGTGTTSDRHGTGTTGGTEAHTLDTGTGAGTGTNAGLTGTTRIARSSAPTTRAPSHALATAGYVTGGAGVVAVGLGVYFGVDGQRISNFINNYTTDPATAGKPWPDDIRQRQQRGELDNKLETGFLVGGGLALAVGITMIVIGQSHHASSRERVSIVPVATDRSAGLAMTGHF